MKVYIKFLIKTFLNSFIYVCTIMLSLIFILNILTEIEFFKDFEVSSYLPLYTSILNSPALMFEMFPFIFLLSTQVLFIKLFNNDEINIFKYSGLKNSKILLITCTFSFLISISLITIFYSFSSSLKNYYLQLKTNYTSDGKYLVVITNNGLWIKDKINEDTYIVNASKISGTNLIETFITHFDENYNVIRNINSKKIDVTNNEWILHDVEIFSSKEIIKKEKEIIKSNFNYQKIKSLFSNLSALSMLELFELKKNYNQLNYSTTEVDIQIQKLYSYPLYLTVMTLLSAIIMFSSKNFKNSTIKITFGLALSVIIYYLNNFFNVLGNTEKISIILSVWLPIMIITTISLIFTYKINEK